MMVSRRQGVTLALGPRLAVHRQREGERDKPPGTSVQRCHCIILYCIVLQHGTRVEECFLFVVHCSLLLCPVRRVTSDV